MNRKISILVISLLCIGCAIVAMEKPQEESKLASFIARMQAKNNIMQQELLKFRTATNRPMNELDTRIDILDVSKQNPNFKLFDYSFPLIYITPLPSFIGITILQRNMDFNKKQQVIKQLLQNGVKPTQDDIDIAFLYEYQHDPLKFERRWEVIKGYYSPDSPLSMLPTEMIFEIIKHMKNDNLLIPKENMPSQ